jgi:lysozyme
MWLVKLIASWFRAPQGRVDTAGPGAVEGVAPAPAPSLVPVQAVGDVPAAALALIERFEGCHLAPYLCPAGKPTIGIGTTRYPSGVAVRLTDYPIPRDVALEYLRNDLLIATHAVARLVDVPLTEGQRAALVLFVHNGGAGMLGNSTLLKRLNQSDFATAAMQFDLFVNARVNGVLTPQRGLRIRRRAERYLFQGYDAAAAYQQARMDFPR